MRETGGCVRTARRVLHNMNMWYDGTVADATVLLWFRRQVNRLQYDNIGIRIK